MAHAGGRPSKYQKIFAKKIIKFFDRPTTVTNSEGKIVPNDFPFFEAFARSIDVDFDTMNEWCKATLPSGKLKHPEFSEAYKKAKQIQQNFWQENSLAGRYNPAFTIFFGKNVFHWNDKQELDVKSDGKAISGFNYLPPISKNGEDNTNNQTNS